MKLGFTTLPPSSLSLNDALVCPQIVKDLISVRKLSTDNNVSVEFNLSGFSVKALPTQTPLLTSSSAGPLYPFYGNKSVDGAAFFTTPGDLWHQHLNHPGKPSLASYLQGFFFQIVITLPTLLV